MKINKKILCAFLLAPAALLTACGGGGSDDNKDLAGTYAVKMWVSENAGVAESFEAQITAFNEANPGIVIQPTIEKVSEADSATSMLNDVEKGADIYCFAQDQFARLVQGGALGKLGKSATQFVKDNNTEGSIKAVTSGTDLYAYPLTADNGYFMFYDKRVITDESHLGSLEQLVTDCEDAGKIFAFEMESSAWYNVSFFFGAGCHSKWTTDSDGKFQSVDDDFNSDKGLIAARGMQHLVQSNCHFSSSQADVFSAATPAAILVSGTWAYDGVKDALGEENVGFAELPSYTVDGKSYHLGSYSGNKLMGVKPQTDAKRSSVLNKLAQYLTGEECQKQRVEQFSWGPSNKAVLELPVVKNNKMLTALAAQNEYATVQGQIHGSWWDIAKVISTDVKAAAKDDEVALRAALKKYDDAIHGILTMDPEEARAYTVIGSIASLNCNWDTDIKMVEAPENTWTTENAIELKAGDEFKCRQGKSWDVAYGNGTENYKITEDCTKKIQLVVEGETGTISLVD